MRPGPILITSFRTWRAHQLSNSSDDLIAAMVASRQMPTDAVWLSQVPVHFEVASAQVISEMMRLRPRAVICCGMAERRSCLNIESQAKGVPADGSKEAVGSLKTSAKVADLLVNTVLSEVSNDAGRYVCNRLYYDVLRFIQTSDWETIGLFIHVPILNKENKPFLLSDFVNVVENVRQQLE